MGVFEFTKILAMTLSMKIYENPGNDIVYEKFTKILAMAFSMKNLRKSWQ